MRHLVGGARQLAGDRVVGAYGVLRGVWEQVFSGDSPNAILLQGHLTKMFEEHQDIALAFEELIEAEEANGNLLLDEVPTGDSRTTGL